jgi:hypothetical protein
LLTSKSPSLQSLPLRKREREEEEEEEIVLKLPDSTEPKSQLGRGKD